MTKKEKESLAIAIISVAILAINFLLPVPTQYKGPASGLLPYVDISITTCGIAGLIYSFYLFLKKE